MASRYNSIDDKQLAKLMDAYPQVSDLKERARKRIPNVAWQYLETGTGRDEAMQRNREALDQITFVPRYLKGKLDIKLETTLFGKTYAAPFGIAPMGLCGLIWPGTESILARAARDLKIPYTLSTVATQTPEMVGPQVGDMGWFQLYPPKDPEVRKAMLKRAADAGFHTLIITADVPSPGRREESRKAGLSVPPNINLKMIWEGATHPAWSMEVLKNGLPRLKFAESFSPKKDLKSAALYTRFEFRVTWIGTMCGQCARFGKVRSCSKDCNILKTLSRRLPKALTVSLFPTTADGNLTVRPALLTRSGTL